MALAVDASSPGTVFFNGTSSSCGLFTPPAGALLVIAMRYNTGTGDTPGAPTITDSLGTHLTYTLREHDRRPDSPLAEGAVAVWTAVATGAAMTITVGSSGTAATGNALKVQVWTESTGGTPGVGTVLKASTITATNSITVNVLATATGSNAILAFENWDASGTPVAGTGCTSATGDAVAQGATLAYALINRTSPDGVSGSNIALQLNAIGGGANLRWIGMEITPPVVTDTPPTTPGTPSVSSITTTGANVSWTASTDDNGVSFYEVVVEPA